MLAAEKRYCSAISKAGSQYRGVHFRKGSAALLARPLAERIKAGKERGETER